MPGETSALSRNLSKSRDDVVALLTVNKGSRFIPIVVLVLAALAFILNALASVGSREALKAKFREACSKVRETADIANGRSRDSLDPGTIARAEARLREMADGTERDWSKTPLAARCAFSEEPIDTLVARFRRTNFVTANEMQSFTESEIGGPQGVGIIIAAGIKDYVDALWSAAVHYWQAAVVTVATTALFALVPGVAGLVYRRAFWSWFGVGFAVILAISAVSASLGRLFGTTAARDPVVESAAGVSILVLVQLAVLLLAFRLRRHTTKPPFVTKLVSPHIYNRVLFALLIVVAVGTVVDLLGSRQMWNGLWAALPFSDTVEWLNVILLGLPFAYAVLKVTETWSGTRAKNIVVCLDGTSNTPDQYDMGFLSQTNVFKLFKMLKADKPGSFVPAGRFDATLCKTYRDKQIAFYYTGIGNTFDTDPVFGTLAQATGMGASGIIERAYLDVLRVWRPGDRVFIVGFSRGAASARILSRVIDERGAPGSIWTLRLFGRHWSLLPSRAKEPISIDVLGCWDTVGSFGLVKTIAGINFQQLNLLHDMSVPENVDLAVHMVALDEERQEFEPTLMEPDPIRPERIVEVWFPGSHAGVGGGFATDRLSDVPLDFLLTRLSSGYSADGVTVPGDESWGVHLAAVNAYPREVAEAHEEAQRTAARAASEPDDLNARDDAEAAAARLVSLQAWFEEQFRRHANRNTVTIHPDPRGQLRVWISNLYTYRPRQLPLHAHLSESVFQRMKKSEPVYAPQALFDLNDALDAKRDLITEKLDKLDETRSLAPEERVAIQAYADKLRLTRWPQYCTPRQAEARARKLANLTGEPGLALSSGG